MAPSVRMRQACRSLSELSEEDFFNAKNEVVAVCHSNAGESELGCGAMATGLCHNLNSEVYTGKITEACLQIKYMQMFLSGTYAPGDLCLHLLFQIKPVSDAKPTLFLLRQIFTIKPIFNLINKKGKHSHLNFCN